MIEVKAKGNFDNKYPDMPDQIYVPVVDGKEYNRIAETPDMAMILGLAIKYDGLNSQFAQMACRMLNIDSVWKGI